MYTTLFPVYLKPSFWLLELPRVWEAGSQPMSMDRMSSAWQQWVTFHQILNVEKIFSGLLVQTSLSCLNSFNNHQHNEIIIANNILIGFITILFVGSIIIVIIIIVITITTTTTITVIITTIYRAPTIWQAQCCLLYTLDCTKFSQ